MKYLVWESSTVIKNFVKDFIFPTQCCLPYFYIFSDLIFSDRGFQINHHSPKYPISVRIEFWIFLSSNERIWRSKDFGKLLCRSNQIFQSCKVRFTFNVRAKCNGVWSWVSRCKQESENKKDFQIVNLTFPQWDYPGYSIIKQKLSEGDMPRASFAEKFYYKTLDFLRKNNSKILL